MSFGTAQMENAEALLDSGTSAMLSAGMYLARQ
jgi:hypothetical protein